MIIHTFRVTNETRPIHKSLLHLVSGLIISCTIGSCATSPKDIHPTPYYTSPVQTVKIKDVEKFWVGTTVRFDEENPATEAALRNGTVGFVIAEIVIDSNGKVVEQKILESEPNGLFTPSAQKLYALSSYKPAAENQARIPVRFIRATFFGNSKEASEKFHQYVKEKNW